MNIIVTGANGFIGTHLCNFLENHGHTIFRIVRKKQNTSENEIELDLTDKKNVCCFIEEFKQHNNINIIIHLAAKLVDAIQSEDEQLEVLQDNLKITENTVLLLKELKPAKLINFSSIAVYPNINGLFNEKSQIKMSENTDCMYGLAKFCSENIFDFMLKNTNINISHLRVSQVYGEEMRQDRIIPIMKKELKEKNQITVFGEGKRKSNFIHINKLIEILHYFINENIYGIYNIGDEALSYLQLAQRIIKENGNAKSKIIKKKEGSRAIFILDTKKLKETLAKLII